MPCKRWATSHHPRLAACRILADIAVRIRCWVYHFTILAFGCRHEQGATTNACRKVENLERSVCRGGSGEISVIALLKVAA